MATKSILLLAGEASGDHHAAALVQELRRLRPDVEVWGIGGDKVQQAGMRLLFHYRDLNTIGLSEGFRQLGKIIAAYRTMKRELQSGRYGVFVPVDYPDVNLRLAAVAAEAAVRVCYFISPQVWAWRRGRIRKIARRVNQMMTIFPFEEQLYRQAGVKATFVGHTMVHDIPERPDRPSLRRDLGVPEDKTALAMVPGSRPAEIRRMLPLMCEAARLHLEQFPDTSILLPLAGPHLRSLVGEILAPYRIPVSVLSVDAAQVMAACDCGMVTSGTATLQAALAEMPHVIVYKLDALTWWFATRVLKPLVMDKDIHVGIANVLAISAEKEGFGPIIEMQRAGLEVPCLECGRPLFVPELLQHHATPDRLAGWLQRFTTEPALRETMLRSFRQIRQMLSPPLDGKTAAQIVLENLER